MAGWNYHAVAVDGTAAGIWNLRRRGKEVEVAVERFKTPEAREKAGVEDEAAGIGRYLGAPAEVRYA